MSSIQAERQIEIVHRELADLPMSEEWKPVLKTREESEMEDLLNRLQQRGIKAKGKVGYVTTLEAGGWYIGVVNQSDDWRMIVFSHQLPESILFNLRDVQLLRRAIDRPGFSDNPNLAATRELILYEHTLEFAPRGYSPVQVAEAELTRRMVGTIR